MTQSHFKDQQARLIEASSKERKEQEKRYREELEKDYKEAHTWLEGDNQANSPFEADWDDLYQDAYGNKYEGE